MFIINFKRTPEQSFRHGFLKGLAAPMMLFHVEELPAPTVVGPVTLMNRSDAEALAGDWRKVGNDMRSAIVRYGEAA